MLVIHLGVTAFSSVKCTTYKYFSYYLVVFCIFVVLSTTLNCYRPCDNCYRHITMKKLKRKITKTSKRSFMLASMVEELGVSSAHDFVTYDSLLAILKELLPSLTAKDFGDQFLISTPRAKPHKWRMGQDIDECQMEELFGKAQGLTGLPLIIGWTVKLRRCAIVLDSCTRYRTNIHRKICHALSLACLREELRMSIS